jgi:hypothetical protein
LQSARAWRPRVPGSATFGPTPYGVCTFQGLARVTGEARYGELALQLVDQVHHGVSGEVRARLDQLEQYVPMRSDIERFWLEPDHRRVETWLDHENINDVMLATSLEPEGFLLLGPALG